MIESATEVIIARAHDHESWTPGVAASIAAHAVLIAGLLVMPGRDFTKDLPKTVMSISLGGAPGPRAGGMTPMGGKAVQEVAEAAAKPRAETPPAAKAPEMTLPSKDAKVRPKANPDVKPTEAAAGRQATTGDEVREGSTRADTGARGKGFGLTGGGGAGTGAYLDVSDFCCPEYLESIVQLIQRNWNNKQNLAGQTLMKVTIDRAGTLSDVVVERPSGFIALDMAAQRALLITQRVPALPPAFPNKTLTVHFTFEYQRQ